MQDGDRYVASSQNTLYYLPNSSCSEGDPISLSNSLVHRVYNINGNWVKGDLYTTSSYSNTQYVCHVWSNSKDLYNSNYLILPSVLIVLCFFSIVWSWYNRLRG